MGEKDVAAKHLVPPPHYFYMRGLIAHGLKGLSRIFFERLRWSLWTRPLRQLQIRGFRASPLSFCTDSCSFGEYSWIGNKVILIDVRIGRFSYMNSGVAQNCTIGNFCSIGQDVKIGGFGRHPRHISTHPSFYSPRTPMGISFHTVDGIKDLAQVSIEHDVWIGDRALILDGVTIATGAIVGAGAVVTRDVSPYDVVVGVPAHSIGLRVAERHILKLLESRWWTLEVGRLARLAPLIASDDVDAFLDALAEKSSPPAEF